MSYKTAHEHKEGSSGTGHGRKLLGLGLLVLATIWAFSIAAINWSAQVWPIVIAIAGALIILGGSHRGTRRERKHVSTREETVVND